MNVEKHANLKRLGMIIEIVLIVMVVFVVVKRPAPGTRYRDHIVRSVPTAQKVVALTFDDGPHPVYTPRLLDILGEYNVKATFFMIGRNMEAHPDIVRDVVRRGHAIGNHTYTHPRNIELNSRAEMIGELDECEQMIERLTGTRTHLFRPPRGLIDGHAFSIAEVEGYKTVLWSVCADHRDAPTPELMAARVIEGSRPGGIILAHDGPFPTRWRDVAATPAIIEALKRRGYSFVTVPQLLKMR